MRNPKPIIPFCIAADTREQRGLKFPEGINSVVATCYPGDYSLVGFRDLVAIERKGVSVNNNVSTSDLVSTITELLRGQNGDLERGSLRFRWELDAMRRINQAGGVAFVATDRPRSWYKRHEYFGGLSPSSLFGMIRSLTAEYGIQFRFFDSTEDMTNEISGILLELWKHSNGLQTFKISPKDKPPAVYNKWLTRWNGIKHA